MTEGAMAEQVTIEQQLTEASNLLCEYAKRLPPGYSIALHASADECYLELTDPNGDEVDTFEPGWHGAVETAIDDHAEKTATEAVIDWPADGQPA